MSTHSNSMLEVILGGQKQRAWMLPLVCPEWAPLSPCVCELVLLCSHSDYFNLCIQSWAVGRPRKWSTLRSSSPQQHQAPWLCIYATQASCLCPELLRASVAFRGTGASHPFVRVCTYTNGKKLPLHEPWKLNWKNFLATTAVFALKCIGLYCCLYFSSLQRSMNACHILVLMAVHVGTRSDPTCVSAMKVSAESAVRQVKHNQILPTLNPKFSAQACNSCVYVFSPLRHKRMPIGTLRARGDMWGPAWLLLVSLSTRFHRPELWTRYSNHLTCYIPSKMYARQNSKSTVTVMCADQDSCESNPCLNGGMCRGYRRNYLCVCKDGFFGDQCQMCKWL